MVRQRVRIRFAKQGNLRLIGHRDLSRTLERLFRRARLPLAMSQGFHPKPRMSFSSALALGIEGLEEIMELQLTERVEAAPLLAQLNRFSVPGLVFHRVELLPDGAPKARICGAAYDMPVPESCWAETAQRIERLLASRRHDIRRPKRPDSIDLRSHLIALDLENGVLAMRLRISPEANPGPRDVLSVLGLADLERGGGVLRRTAVELQG